MLSPALRRPAQWTPVLFLFLLVLLTGCGINTIPTLQEEVNAGWAQVQNQYQRRADLIPNLVETVKGYAQQEREVLTAVTEARAKVAQMQLPPDILTNEEAFRQFEQNQAQLTGALGRLLVVVEQYPELRSNQNFLALQSQLEGPETTSRRCSATIPRSGPSRDVSGRWCTAPSRRRTSLPPRAPSRRHASPSEPMRRALACLPLLLLAIAVVQAAEPEFPPLTGRVDDRAGLLSERDEAELDAALARFERETTNQIVVATLESLQGLPIEEYGYQLGRHWGIGQEGKDNGALLIVAPEEREVRIEVG